MIRLILYLLEKIPYRTKFGLSLADELKYFYYDKIGQYKKPQRCLCGGRIISRTWYRREEDISWETSCDSCQILIDED